MKKEEEIPESKLETLIHKIWEVIKASELDTIEKVAALEHVKLTISFVDNADFYDEIMRGVLYKGFKEKINE